MAGSHDQILKLRKSHDKSDMVGLVTNFPSQMEEAWQLGERFAGNLGEEPVNKIVVCGMGGSAIGGDMVRSYLGDGPGIPVHVNRSYTVPESLLKDSLLVFSSYSGNTGETLAAYAAGRGEARTAVAITSGGRLLELCEKDGVPACVIPGGMPPRAAIAYSFFPLLHILHAVQGTKPDEGGFREARRTLGDLCRASAAEAQDNPAIALAGQLVGKFPFVYSCRGLLEAVSRRWCTQLNENAKTLAHFATFTELNHNEIVGWEKLEWARSRIAVIMLEDEEDHPPEKRQAEVCLELIEPLVGDVVRVSGVGGGRMARLLGTMILGDFVSVYLAYLNGVDPTPVERIDYLKKKLGPK